MKLTYKKKQDLIFATVLGLIFLILLLIASVICISILCPAVNLLYLIVGSVLCEALVTFSATHLLKTINNCEIVEPEQPIIASTFPYLERLYNESPEQCLSNDEIMLLQCPVSLAFIDKPMVPVAWQNFSLADFHKEAFHPLNEDSAISMQYKHPMHMSDASLTKPWVPAQNLITFMQEKEALAKNYYQLTSTASSIHARLKSETSVQRDSGYDSEKDYATVSEAQYIPALALSSSMPISPDNHVYVSPRRML